MGAYAQVDAEYVRDWPTAARFCHNISITGGMAWTKIDREPAASRRQRSGARGASRSAAARSAGPVWRVLLPCLRSERGCGSSLLLRISPLHARLRPQAQTVWASATSLADSARQGLASPRRKWPPLRVSLRRDVRPSVPSPVPYRRHLHRHHRRHPPARRDGACLHRPSKRMQAGASIRRWHTSRRPPHHSPGNGPHPSPSPAQRPAQRPAALLPVPRRRTGRRFGLCQRLRVRRERRRAQLRSLPSLARPGLPSRYAVRR